MSDILDKLMWFARRRFAVVRISPDVNRTATWVDELLREKGYQSARQAVQHTATIRIDLTPHLDQIISGMKAHRRTQIRQYERDKGDWSFQCDDSSESLDAFYTLYHQTIANAGKKAKNNEDLRNMHGNLSKKRFSFIFIVRYQDRPVVGALNVAVGKRLWYLYGGSVKGEGAMSGSGFVLHWEIIKWAKDRGYEEYDLQGVPDPPNPDDPAYGVYKFKRTWEGVLERLIGEYDYTPYPFLRRIVNWKLAYQ